MFHLATGRCASSGGAVEGQAVPIAGIVHRTAGKLPRRRSDQGSSLVARSCGVSASVKMIPAEFPTIPGLGVVDAVGSDVTVLAVGDDVLGDPR